MDIDHSAPVVVELRQTVRAPLHTIWRLHTEVDSWPTWHAAIDTAVLYGPLAPGAVFNWTTAGLDITSTVAEVTPMHRIVWGGPAHGITGIHVWEFHETDEGVRVSTRESWSGTPVEADPPAMHFALESSLLAWLDALKSTAESQNFTELTLDDPPERLMASRVAPSHPCARPLPCTSEPERA